MEQQDGKRWLKWLHRVGYATTVIVALQITFIAALIGYQWYDHRQRMLAYIEQTRTFEGPLSSVDGDLLREMAARRLNEMTAISAMHGEGLRFVALPSLSTTEYGVVIYLRESADAEAAGVLTTFSSQQPEKLLHRAFKMPADDYRRLMSRVDMLTDGWPGSAEGWGWLDGSAIGFERVRGKRITSGIGSNSDHYRKLGDVMLAAIRRFAPGDDLPNEENWHRVDPEDR